MPVRLEGPGGEGDEVDEAGDRRQECADDPAPYRVEGHRPPGRATEVGHDVGDEREYPKPDRYRNQHHVDGVTLDARSCRHLASVTAP